MTHPKGTAIHDQDAIHKPSKEFSANARIKSLAAYKKLYQESIDRPDKFWAREAKELMWQKPWSKVLSWGV
jgi:acetyl-CoA synthetase